MKTLLIVDDEPVAVRALKNRMKWSSYGYERVLTANSMSEAQSLFEQEEIDLMLCDIEMPDGTGLELFAWVKSYFPYVECIYVTCHPKFDYIQKALRLGSFDYILKPVDYDELGKILENVNKRLEEDKAIKERVHRNARKRIQYSETRDLPGNEIVAVVKHYVDNHLQEEILMDDIAEHVFLNPQYMVRLFKREEGISILEYITERRIARAEELLRNTDYAVFQIADMVGYSNYSYFNRVFKKVTGETPKEYKKNRRQ